MILTGDALEQLRGLASESVQCCVTSPPYFGLRNYGVDGQLGLEKTPQEYIAKMVEIFEEVRRVLRKDGTCWVNLGDGFSAKELQGMPWRLAFALQGAGWYLRSDIIWHKPNPMPESVRDRPTKAHEYIFLLSKSARYYYDADAIRTEPSVETKQLSYDTMDYTRRDKYKMPDGWNTGEGAHGSFRPNGREKGRTILVPDAYKGSIPGRKDGPGQDRRSSNHRGKRTRAPGGEEGMPPSAPDRAEREGCRDGANSRTVWTISTQAYREAHFATFPEELPRRCILAGSREGDTILDPFLGSGTTYAVALQLGRKCIGIELNPEYVALARRRIADVTPSMFGEVG